MGSYISTKDIARIMSEETGYKVRERDVTHDVNTVTTSIYSAVVYNNEDEGLNSTVSILCIVRNGEYKVETNKIR